MSSFNSPIIMSAAEKSPQTNNNNNNSSNSATVSSLYKTKKTRSTFKISIMQYYFYSVISRHK